MDHLIGQRVSTNFGLICSLTSTEQKTVQLGFDKFKHTYLCPRRSHKGFKGIALYAMHGGSLEITLTVPLILMFKGTPFIFYLYRSLYKSYTFCFICKFNPKNNLFFSQKNDMFWSLSSLTEFVCNCSGYRCTESFPHRMKAFKPTTYNQILKYRPNFRFRPFLFLH